MAYQDNYTLIADSTFQVRVKMAAAKAATQILGGAASGSGATVDAKRDALAKAAIIGGAVNGIDMTPTSVADRFIYVLAALGTTNTDEAVDTAIASVWNDLACVELGDAV